MNTNLIIAIALNIGLLLIVCLGFSIFAALRLSKEKQRLLEQIKKLQKKTNNPATEPLQNNTTDDDLSAALKEMEQELEEKEERINKLLSVKDNQQKTQSLLDTLAKDDNADEELLAQISLLHSDSKETEKIILALQTDLDISKKALEKMKHDVAVGEMQAVRVATLERTERRMRDENKKLRKVTAILPKQLDIANAEIKQLKKDKVRLEKTVKTLANASDKQLEIIKKLHAEVERASQLEEYQKGLISDLEKRLRNEKNNGNDAEKVKEIENELKRVKEKLEHTMIEKDFIEGYMIELDDSLEKAKETEEALAKARKEIKSLEQSFPEYEPKIKTEESDNKTDTEPKPQKTEKPEFTTDIAELNDIIEDNRLFGALQEFWSTLDAPPLRLMDTQNITVPNHLQDWVHTTIGDNDYSVLITLDHDLRSKITELIFKGEINLTQKLTETTGKLSEIIANTIATELDSNFPIGVSEHIKLEDAQKLINENTLVTEVMMQANDQLIYATLIQPISGDEKTS